MTFPSKDELLERERRWLRPAGLIAIGGALILAAGIAVQQLGLSRADDDPERLTQFHEHASQLIAGQILQSFGFALFAVPLYVLFQAAAGRAERVRRNLVLLVVIGPLLYAISTVIFSFGIKQVADDFVERAPAVEQQARQQAEAEGQPGGQTDAGQQGGGKPRPETQVQTTTAPEEVQTPDEAAENAREELADDVVDDSGAAKVGQGLRLPAVLALVFGLVYVSLWSMRTGLLTRFWGSLGMALGVSLILLGFVGVMGIVLWFAAIGLMFIGRWPGPRPPAWEAGEAIPWPRPGEEPTRASGEPMRGDTVEGSGREVSEPPLPEGEAWPPAGQGAGEAGDQPAGETQGQRRKKRKRRG